MSDQNNTSEIPYVFRSFANWSRLEPRQREVDFDRSLSAEVRDPLWMLTRQWQWGEFKGEDTGSAIFAKVEVQTSRVTRFANNIGAPASSEIQQDGSTFNNTASSIPMEARVEQLKVPFDEHIGMQLGRRWEKMLKVAPFSDEYYQEYLGIYPFIATTGVINTEYEKANQALSQMKLATQNRTIDGRQLYEAIVGGTPASDSLTIPASDGVASDENDIDDLGDLFVAWVQKRYLQPDTPADSSWNKNQMEYQFACTVPNEGPTGTAPTSLVAKEYYHGRLDWYSFDIAGSNDGVHSSMKSGSNAAERDQITSQTFTMLPTDVRFAGMPSERYWEFEDGHVDLGDIDANEMDTGKLLFAEYAMVYGNEWSIIPYEVPTGSLSEVKCIVVKDVFGQKLLVEAAGAGQDSDWQRWNMYNLNHTTDGGQADNRLFIPPVLHAVQESEPIESVNFIRDETANMVWGVESIIPDGLGGGMSGYEIARRVVDNLTPESSETELDPLEKVFAQYTLSKTVPENWIPFIPVRLGTFGSRDIQLQRGTLPRVIPGLNFADAGITTDEETIKPRSYLLSKEAGYAPSPHYIYEEEVPRSGSIVKTTWQRARWYDGTTYLWLGRRKTNGKGEGSSGLLFDQLDSTVVDDEL